jgi:hypothetical protein
VDAIVGIAARLLRADVASADAIGGGRNSRVYRIVTTGQQVYALKCYFPRADNRNCLAREFGALDFLRRNDISNVPASIAADEAAGCAAYEFVDGVKVSGAELSEADIDAAAAFICRLRELASQPDSAAMSPAADACFSVAQTLRYLRARLSRLQAHGQEGAAEADFRQFMAGEFAPAMERIVAESCRDCATEVELAPHERSLSPSDFGFHNALLRGGQEWVFLDFEYFGWDDPVKTVSDFLLHPGMELTEDHKQRFVRGLRESFYEIAGFAERLRRAYPLYGLIWCLILLNEFVPEHLRRRQFAAEGPRDHRVVQQEQLAKARRMLQRVCHEYRHFPYFD